MIARVLAGFVGALAITMLLASTATADDQPISVTPASHNFGSVVVGSHSAFEPFVVSLDLTVRTNEVLSDVTVAGAAASDFTVGADTCDPVSLTGDDPQCAIAVQFVPKAKGSLSADLEFTETGDGASQREIPISGTGLAPVTSPLPSSMTFGPVPVGENELQAVTVQNTGTAALSITGETLGGGAPGDYSLSGDTCIGVSVAPDDSCSVNALFAPTVTGPRTASLTFSDNQPSCSTVCTVALSGTGIEPAFSAPASVAFPDTTVGQTNAESLTITNSGSAPMTVSAVQLSGAQSAQFAITSDSCLGAGAGVTVAAGLSCAIGLEFSPTTATASSTALIVTDNAPDSPETISVTGAGEQPASSGTGSGSGASSGSGAGSGSGSGTTGGSTTPAARPAPSPAQIRAVLRAILKPTGLPGGLRSLLKGHSYRFIVRFPAAGRAALSWTCHHAGKRQTVATASVRSHHAGNAEIALHLTRVGKRLLRKLRPLRVLERATFTPTSGKPRSATSWETVG